MCGCQPHVMLLLSNTILMEHTKILFPDINDRNSMYISIETISWVIWSGIFLAILRNTISILGVIQKPLGQFFILFDYLPTPG